MANHSLAIKAVTLILAVFMVCGSTFALNSNSTEESMALTKHDYIMQVIEENNITLQNVPEGINIDVYEYTALKLGILQGVSFDFNSQINENDMERIQSNLANIDLPENKDTEGVNESINESVEMNSDTSMYTPIDPETPVYNFSTPYGEIKTPTDIHVNDNIWTDEEFHNLLIENPRMFNRAIIARNNEDAEIAEYWGEQWYYNTDTKHIMLRGGSVGKNEAGRNIYNYIDLDKEINGRAFPIMKALLYHGQKHNMNLQFMPQVDESLRIRISEKDHGGGNIVFLIYYNPEKRDPFYNHIEGYDSSENPVETEWMIERLWDWNIYHDNGLHNKDFSKEEHRDYIMSYDFADQNYADFMYGICDYIYEDGMDVYRAMMAVHIQEEYEFFNDIEDEYDLRMVETDHQEIYIFDQKSYSDLYGITFGKDQLN